MNGGWKIGWWGGHIFCDCAYHLYAHVALSVTSFRSWSQNINQICMLSYFCTGVYIKIIGLPEIPQTENKDLKDFEKRCQKLDPGILSFDLAIAYGSIHIQNRKQIL